MVSKPDKALGYASCLISFSTTFLFKNSYSQRCLNKYILSENTTGRLFCLWQTIISYSGTPLIYTQMGLKKMPFIVRCPCFSCCIIINKSSIWDEKHPVGGVSSFHRCPFQPGSTVMRNALPLAARFEESCLKGLTDP